MSSSFPSEQYNHIDSLVRQLASILTQRDQFLATAESCTGGWIAQSITALAGSSAWFDSGFVTYSNTAKQRLLQVPAELLKPGGPGAVSEETVLAMTAGAIANSEASVAVSVSGVAGPDGGSPEKPVGTVWIGWQIGDTADAKRYVFDGDREAVRLATVETALAGLVERLSDIN